MTGPEPHAPSAAGVRRVLANAVFLLMAYVLPRLLTLGAVVVAARVLGAARFGQYGTAAAYAVILSLVSTLGAMPLLVREIARDPGRAPALLRAAHLVKTGSNVVMVAVLLGLAVFVLDYPQPVVAAALLLGVAYAIGSYVENLGAYFQALERMHVWLGANAVYGLVTGGLGAVLVLTTGNLVLFCVAPVAGQLGALGFLVVRYRRAQARQRVAATPTLPRGVSPAPGLTPGSPLRASGPPGIAVTAFARALVPFAASFIALTLFYKLDVLLLAELRAATDVGLYAAGYKFADITIALATVVATAMYPRLSRLGAGAEQERRAWAGARLGELVLLGAVPVAATLWLLRGLVVGGLFGPGYEGTVPVVTHLAPALPALALNIVAAYLLAAFGHMHRVAALYAGAVVVKVVLDLLFIPRWGAAGAALAMLSAEWLAAGAFLVSLWAVLGARLDRRAVAAAGVAAAAAALAALVTDTVGVGIAVVLYVVAVPGVYWALGVIRPAERNALRSALALTPRWVRTEPRG